MAENEAAELEPNQKSQPTRQGGGADAIESAGPAEGQKRGRPWKLIFFIAGFIVGGVVCFLLLFHRPSDFELIAIKPYKGGKYHKAVPGRPVLLKVMMRARPGALFDYAWDFGDGSKPESGRVTDYYNLGASHDYKDAKPGDAFRAMITVTDRKTGRQRQRAYYIHFEKADEAVRKEIAIEDGLWALHVAAKRENNAAVGRSTHWDDPSGYWLGVTAMNTLAFELLGYDLSSDANDPYVENVRRALNRMVQALEPRGIQKQPAGNPDTNGNRIGIGAPASSKAMYEVPMVLMAIASSGAPRSKVTLGAEGVEGLTFRQLAEDIVEFLAWGQTDNGDWRGGWRYRANSHDADMSATQWPVIAFLAADSAMKIKAPKWIASELKNHFLKTVQANDGGFGYKEPEKANVGLTAAGIICLEFSGVKSNDPRFAKAAEAVGRLWDADGENLGNYYAMYTVMKAALLADKPLENFGKHNWRAKYTDYLLKTQTPDGLWPPGADHIKNQTLATSISVMILGEKVFASRARGWWWPVAVLGVLLVLVIALLLARAGWKKRQSDGAEPAALP